MKFHLCRPVLSLKVFVLLSFISVPLFVGAQSTGEIPQLGRNAVSQVVEAMSLAEKAKLVVGMNQDSQAVRIPKKVPGTSRTHPVDRLGIPSVTLADGPAGVRIDPIRNKDSSKTYYTTAFPVATLLASTWDTAVVNEVGAALGGEALDYGVDIMLMPGMDIQRNPLGGRNYEYYSEDPFLSGHIAAAMVKGVQSQGVGATIKHFAANNQETSRHFINVIAGQRALREIYLRNFEIAVKEGNPWAVMSSYNQLNGAYTSQRKDLLTDILREEWGFKGMVMTDWAESDKPAVQMKAGNDLLMPGHPDETEKIIKAVKEGNLPIDILNRNVDRILKTWTKTPVFKQFVYSNTPDLKRDARIARSAAAEGMVLLKNDQETLPLKKVKKVALFGYDAYSLLYGGTGSGHVDAAYAVSLDEGMQHSGYEINGILQEKYRHYLEQEKPLVDKTDVYLAFKRHYGILEMRVDPALIKQAAKQDDLAIITIGRNAGEGRDRKMQSFYLSLREKELLKEVSNAFHAAGKRVVVVLNIAGPIDVKSWKAEADAILVAWLPGQEGGNAIADILSGKVNPSGKLAQTFPVKYTDVPSAGYFPGAPARNTREVTYTDGIYVGYRYYNTFHVKTAYPFGYGLSYTQFKYSDMQLSSREFHDSVKVAVRITNTGAVAGKEVVELYLSAPAKQLNKPSEELKGFAKTKWLHPGESQVLHFNLNAASLASFDPTKDAWVAEAGVYTVKVGASSTAIKQEANFSLNKSITVEKVHHVLVPALPIPEFNPSGVPF